jgi:hypothetical protein
MRMAGHERTMAKLQRAGEGKMLAAKALPSAIANAPLPG